MAFFDAMVAAFTDNCIYRRNSPNGGYRKWGFRQEKATARGAFS
jgi:hypothetical protein